jgi:hypothetical protein
MRHAPRSAASNEWRAFFARPSDAERFALPAGGLITFSIFCHRTRQSGASIVRKPETNTTRLFAKNKMRRILKDTNIINGRMATTNS